MGFIKRGILGDGDAGDMDGERRRTANPYDLEPINVGGNYYVAVAGSEGTHLITVTNPDSLQPNNHAGVRNIGKVTDIDKYVLSGTTYVAIIYEASKAIQLYSINGNALAFGEHRIDTTRLLDPSGLATYSTATGTYAVITANKSTGTITEGGSGAGRVNILNLPAPSTKPSFVSQIQDNGSLALQSPSDVAHYSKGNNHYAVVTSTHDNGIQILNITTPNSPSATGQLTDTANLLLDGAHAVDVYSIGNKHYAVVIQKSTNEGGIQIIDITDPNRPTGAGKIQSNDT
ncbi:MAG: hypothetical protein OXC46_10125, partial [Thaumarchaeota archaeon]|nr:hypothetical protein [Nitrososphaerota archaeon]